MKLKSKCVIWTGATNNKGYGQKHRNGKTHLAHRLAYADANPKKDISSKLVCHKCDVKRCVNPDHLFLGTAFENTQDMIKKGRAKNARGEEAGKAKLTWEEVREIRRTYTKGKGLIAMARKYGINKNTLLCVVNKRTWIEKRSSV